MWNERGSLEWLMDGGGSGRRRLVGAGGGGRGVKLDSRGFRESQGRMLDPKEFPAPAFCLCIFLRSMVPSIGSATCLSGT